MSRHYRPSCVVSSATHHLNAERENCEYTAVASRLRVLFTCRADCEAQWKPRYGPLRVQLRSSISATLQPTTASPSMEMSTETSNPGFILRRQFFTVIFSSVFRPFSCCATTRKFPGPCMLRRLSRPVHTLSYTMGTASIGGSGRRSVQ